MRRLSNEMIGRLLYQDTVEELEMIEAKDYSFVKADEPYRKRINEIMEGKEKRKCKLNAKRWTVIVAAAILASIIVIFAVASRSCSAKVDFKMSMHEKYADLYITGDNLALMKKEIKESYTSPFFEQEGFVHAHYPSRGIVSVKTVWERDDLEKEIILTQLPAYNYCACVDIEDVPWETKYISDKKVMSRLKLGVYMTIWIEDGYVFNLIVPKELGWESVEEIVKTMQPISEQ